MVPIAQADMTTGKGLALIAAAPFIGLAYVLFLPIIGLLMIFTVIGGGLLKKRS